MVNQVFSTPLEQSRHSMPLTIVLFVAVALLHQYVALIRGALSGIGVQFDLVIFTSAAIFFCGLALVVSGQARATLSNPAFGPLLAFAGWMTASLIWTIADEVAPPASVSRIFGPDLTYPVFKWMDFLSGCFVPFFVAAIVAQLYPSAVRIHVTAAAIFMLGLVPYVLANSIVTNIAEETGIEVGIISGVDYIGFGLYFANLVIIMVVVALRTIGRPLIVVIALAAALAAFYVILISGSTQALLAPLLTIALIVLLDYWNSWRNNRHVRLLVLTIGILAALTIFVTLQSTDALNEYDNFVGISRLLSRLDEESSLLNPSDRAVLHDQAIDGFLGSPLYGLGIGGFSAISYSLVRDYPHNIILEILCELGALGLLLFGWFALRVGQAALRVLGTQTMVGDIIFGSVALYGISSLVSSGLNDHRVLFLYLGYLVGMSNVGRSIARPVAPQWR
jgi:O-antigen ligase